MLRIRAATVWVLSANSRPFISGLGFNYVFPTWGENKMLKYATRDWELGGFLQYTSGIPFAPPVSTTTPNISAVGFQTTVQNRVPGQALFTEDLNCHCFDPNTTFVLNRNAWVNPTAGQFGNATYYNDYRQQRRPLENLSLQRSFRFKERINFSLRGELTNVFNRTFMQNPTATNPAAPQTRTNNADPNSQTTAGFGFINNTTVASAPRQGQIVGRFTF